MNSRLPRRPSTASWYWVASFWSTVPRGSLAGSIAPRSSSGRASAVDSVWTRSAGWTAPAAITAETKLERRSFALRVRSSAALVLSLPALTSTRATPESIDGDGSINVSIGIGWQTPDHQSDNDRRSNRGWQSKQAGPVHSFMRHRPALPAGIGRRDRNRTRVTRPGADTPSGA